MRALGPVVLSLLLALGVPALAHAQLGCLDGTACRDTSGDGPCDSSCVSFVCAELAGEAVCIAPGCSMCRPASSVACPTLTFGNHVTAGTEHSSGTLCRYELASCGARIDVTSAGVAIDAGDDCEVDPSGGLPAFLSADCDLDGITNALEGVGQSCDVQLYTAYNSTAFPSACVGCACLTVRQPFGDWACATEPVLGYACIGMDPAVCPSDRTGRTVAGCIAGPRHTPTCIYDNPCALDATTLARCYGEAPAAADWLTTAFAAGDCDGDGVLNGIDPELCSAGSADAGVHDGGSPTIGVDAASSEDAGASSDAGPSSDAGALDAGPRDDAAVESWSFHGSGFSCRAGAPARAPAWLGVGLAAVLGWVLRRRPRR